MKPSIRSIFVSVFGVGMLLTLFQNCGPAKITGSLPDASTAVSDSATLPSSNEPVTTPQDPQAANPSPTPVVTSPTPTPVPAATPFEKIGRIVTSVEPGDDFCMDLDGGTFGSGVAINQWDCTNETNQNWHLKPIGGGLYNLISTLSGKCVSVRSGGTADWTRLVTGTCDGRAGQAWAYQPSADGTTFRLMDDNSKKCISAPNDYQNVELYILGCGNNRNETLKW